MPTASSAMVADPVHVRAAPWCAGATMLWRRGPTLFLTVVARATLRWVSEGQAAVIEPAPVARDEVFAAGGVLETPGEIAPFLAGAEVYAVGAVPTVRGAQQSVRLGVRRGGYSVLDKTVHLSGTGAPLATGLGPLSRRSQERAQLRGSVDRRILEGAVILVPDHLDPRYFHTAPHDQWVAGLQGGDDLFLVGVSPDGRTLRTTLPRLEAHAQASVGSEHVDVPLALDTLIVTLASLRCGLLFRGHVPLHADPASVRVQVSVHPAGTAPNFSAHPSVPPISAVPAAPASSAVAPRAWTPQPHAEGTMHFGAQSTARPEPTTFLPDSARPAPPADLGGTVNIDDDAVAALRARFASNARAASGKGMRPPPPPAPPPPPPPARSPANQATPGNSTADVENDEIARLRAEHATPFPKAPLPKGPSPKEPGAGSKQLAAKVISAAAPSAPARPKKGAFPRRGETVDVEDDDVARLRAQFATPFQQPAPASAPPDKQRLDTTTDVEADEVARLRAQFATPFEEPGAVRARTSGAPPSTAPRPPEAPVARSKLGETFGLDGSSARDLLTATPFDARSPSSDPPRSQRLDVQLPAGPTSPWARPSSEPARPSAQAHAPTRAHRSRTASDLVSAELVEIEDLSGLGAAFLAAFDRSLALAR